MFKGDFYFKSKTQEKKKSLKAEEISMSKMDAKVNYTQEEKKK